MSRLFPAIVIALTLLSSLARADAPKPNPAPTAIFNRENLVAWCIVPFDSKHRGPEERAAMLERLGFTHFAYDWRAEHVPSFDAEVDALKRHGVALDAFWVAPGELNDDSRRILDLLKRHGLKTTLWALIDLGADRVEGAEQARRVEAGAAKLKPLAEEAGKIGCEVALYNHGGWFGEPENQIAIIERLKAEGVTNVGLVYNLHHGHDHLDRLPALLKAMMPYLKTININGMDPQGDRVGRKILPLGQGERDLSILRTIVASGYHGPIGILGHTQDDAEARLRDNLDGLDWLLPQLDGHPAGPRPTPRTPLPPKADADPATALIREARAQGDPQRGAQVFARAESACLSCHKVGHEGGQIGPDLSTVGTCLTPEEIAESVLWPRKQVKDGYAAKTVVTLDGKVRQGYLHNETDRLLTLIDPPSGNRVEIPKAEIEGVRDDGSLMPDGLLASLSVSDQRDLVRFLLDLGRPGGINAAALAQHHHTPAEFTYDRAPLHPERWPGWQEPVNRDRVYDFYAKEAEFFRAQPGPTPALLPAFPGLDGGRQGHWGNQNDDVWTDARWNQVDLGSVLSGVFRGAGVTVPKGVCVRLGDLGEVSACFNPETLCYEAVWTGGFVRMPAMRHGFLGGLILDGKPLSRPEGVKPNEPFVYHGFYRHGRRVVFAYRLGDVEMLDAPWVDERGRFTRVVAPASTHPMAHLTKGGGGPQWPQVFETEGTLGQGGAYVVDTIKPPFQNPWNALLFFGDLDFLPDGSALICTMQGDVWRVDGLDATLKHVRWRRFASGLHQALGLVVSDGAAYVLSRDQITRLHDRDGDGEADFYECFSNAYQTSPSGHDFICGLQRDREGRFLTASGPQGILRISADGRSVEVLATGLRNPDGLGLAPDGTITAPNSEGEWVPASMVCEIQPGGHYGAGGPRDGQPPSLPLVYLPRGLDNSSGGQVFVTSDRFGPLRDQFLHFSFGAGSHFLLLRDQVGGQPQGAAVPLPGEFRSGAHRGRFNPVDGQLYVVGMAGWGSYTTDDGSLQRVRYTGKAVQLPTSFHALENGVLVSFSSPLDREIAENPSNQFAQAWNYQYSAGYGSAELSPSHPGVAGHDPVPIRSAHVLDDGATLFLEIPDLQPVNQLHLHLQVDQCEPVDLFATVHRLAPPFTAFPGYTPPLEPKTIAAHPILADMVALTVKPVPNPWRKSIPGAREIMIEAGKNLSYSVRSFTVQAGEPIRLRFLNPDSVPHNWALVKPGKLAQVGDLANKLIADPGASSRQYIPKSDDVLVYTDVVSPQNEFSISFLAPTEPGRYPYLCTFPGHWMVMNGELIVAPPRARPNSSP